MRRLDSADVVQCLEESSEHFGIEVASFDLSHHVEGLLMRERHAVGAVHGERIIEVHNRADPGLQRN